MDFQGGFPGHDAVEQTLDEASPVDDDQPVRPTYSFQDLCLPLYGELMNFARRLTGSDLATAADVVHDSMEKAMRAWPRFVPVDPDNVAHSARAWLYRVVANTYTKVYHRRRVRNDANHHRPAEVIAGAHGTACAIARDYRNDHAWLHPDRRNGLVMAVPAHVVDSPFGDEVLAAIAQLSADHQAVVELHYVRDMGCAEMAIELGIPKNTVFTRLLRAREHLERLLGSYPAQAYNFRRCASMR
jgi:RNA polymerase sigma factor (sigma-70 family)